MQNVAIAPEFCAIDRLATALAGRRSEKKRLIPELPRPEWANATASVGSYAPNAWGLYDTHGNVWEWCLDWYASALIGGTDPVGADSGSSRVLRGGSWDGTASSCRSAYRNFNGPSIQTYDMGLRLVRTLP